MNKRKKILHIAGKMSLGGSEKAIYQLIKGQRLMNIDADLLIGHSAAYMSEKTKDTGAQVHYLNLRKGFDISGIRKFIEIKRNYDVIHFQRPNPFLLFWLKPKKDQKIYYTHRSGKHNYPLKRLVMYKLFGYLLKSKMVVLSGNTIHASKIASRLFNIPLSNIMVTYNGIDTDLLKPIVNSNEIKRQLSINEDTPIISTSANLRRWKRIDLLLKAIAKIDSLPYKLLIIGDGPEKKSLIEYVERLGIVNKVIFTGKVNYVSDYLQVSDIFVLPSDEGESFGNSAVEAMAMGLPTVVMRDGGGLTEHINDEINGFIANDVIELSSLIKKLLRDKNLRKEIGKNSAHHVSQKYSIHKCVESYINLYAQ